MCVIYYLQYTKNHFLNIILAATIFQSKSRSRSRLKIFVLSRAKKAYLGCPWFWLYRKKKFPYELSKENQIYIKL